MCLYTKKGELQRKIAKEDIQCFKVMQRTENGRLITPYTHTCLEVGKLYIDDKDEDIREGKTFIGKEDYSHYAPFYKIYKGFYHTFKGKNDAIKACERLNKNLLRCEGSHQVHFCVIPSGTEYIEGMDNDMTDNYASKSIILGDCIHC